MTVPPPSQATSRMRLQIGGTLVPGRDLYVIRPEDDQVLHLLVDGEYVNVLASRQVGKSSLYRQVEVRLKERGWHVAGYDLSELGSPVNAKDYFRGLIAALIPRLQLQLDVDGFWAKGTGETPSQRLVGFFRDVVLRQFQGPVAIFLDEIDSTLKFAYTDDLFTALRAIYNERPVIESYRRLVFCLIGVATPDELIKDRRTTPYNVGQTIWLGDFNRSHHDLSSLSQALHEDDEVGEKLLDRVLYWTAGHPFLTVSLCKHVIDSKIATEEGINQYVEQTYSTLDRLGEDVHIQQILRFVDERLTDERSTLGLYKRILSGNRERDQSTLIYAELKLSGLVTKNADGYLTIRNRIYRRLFDELWIQSTRPIRSTQRYRRLAMVTTVALITTIALATGYYGLKVQPQQTLLAARQVIERQQISLTSSLDGTLQFAFPPHTTDGELAQAMQQIQLIAKNSPRKPMVTLRLTNTRVSDLSPLANLTNLQELSITNTQVSDLTPVANLTNLQELSITNTQVSDLTPVTNLTNLRRLYLVNTPLSDLTPLAHLTNLQELNIMGTSVSDLSPLANLTNLQELVITSTEGNDLTPLANLRNLRRLYLAHTPVSDLTPVANLTNLQELAINNTQVSDLTPVAKLTNLRLLWLYDTPVSDLTPLAKLKTLEFLQAENTNVKDVTVLRGLTNLRNKVSISNFAGVPIKGIELLKPGPGL